MPVLFKFQPDVSPDHKAKFVSELKTFKSLQCVLHRLTVGGPFITDPIDRSKGFHFALLSYTGIARLWPDIKQVKSTIDKSGETVQRDSRR